MNFRQRARSAATKTLPLKSYRLESIFGEL
jgi:hypothetical protein